MVFGLPPGEYFYRRQEEIRAAKNDPQQGVESSGVLDLYAQVADLLWWQAYYTRWDRPAENLRG